MRNLEREWTPRSLGGSKTSSECPCREHCQRVWLQSPQDRELKFVFSLAEIFGINKQMSLEPILLHLESSFIRVVRGEDNSSSKV